MGLQKNLGMIMDQRVKWDQVVDVWICLCFV